MMKDMTKGVLVARALALAIALVGVTLGPGGVAAATPARARTPGYALAGAGETAASRWRVGDRGAIALDDGSDSGDGGDGDDGGDDE
jgi:hypothetical protein